MPEQSAPIAALTRLLRRWWAWHMPHRCPAPVYPPIGRDLTDAEARKVQRYFEHSCPKHTVVVKGDFGPEDLA